MKTVSTGSQPLGQNSRTAIAIAPSAAPTAIAAGRLRPARDFLGASAPSGVPVSGSATEVGRSVRLDLEQLAFFVLDEVVDLLDVLMSCFFEVLLRVFDLVFAGLAVFLDPVEFLHRLAADVAHRHPGVLALGPCLL